MPFFDILKKNKKNPLPESSAPKRRSVSAKKSSGENSAPVLVRVDASREGGESFASVLLHPRITEKASFITEDGGYTFEVSPRSNKMEVKKAFFEAYGVKPRRVNIITIPAKQVTIRNRSGVKSGGKKAVVFLKKGDKIEFV